MDKTEQIIKESVHEYFNKFGFKRKGMLNLVNASPPKEFKNLSAEEITKTNIITAIAKLAAKKIKKKNKKPVTKAILMSIRSKVIIYIKGNQKLNLKFNRMSKKFKTSAKIGKTKTGKILEKARIFSHKIISFEKTPKKFSSHKKL